MMSLNTKPTKVDKNFRPCVWATKPVVKATVDNQRIPMAAENTRTLASLNGVNIKIVITTALLAYIPASNFGFEYS